MRAARRGRAVPRRGVRTARAAAACAVLATLAAGCEQARPSPNLLGAPVQPPVPGYDGLLSDTAVQAVVEIHASGSAADLVEALYGTDPATVARATRVAASVRADVTVQAVRDRLSHPDPRVRRGAAFALGQIPRLGTGRWLLERLAVEDDSLARRNLVAALGKAGDETSAQGLVDRAPTVDQADLVLALGRLALRHPPGAGVLDRLVAGLESPDGRVRELAAWYFGRSADTDPWADRADDVRRAVDALAPDDPATEGLLRALGRLADPADVSRVLRFAGSPDWRVRVRTAAALASYVAADDAREALFAALDDPSVHVRVAAATTLGGIRRILEPDQDRIVAWIDANPEDWQTAAPLLGALAAQGRAGFVQDWMEARAGAPLRVRARGIRAVALAPDQGVTRSLMELAATDTVELAVAALDGLVTRWGQERQNRELHAAYWEAFEAALRTADRGIVATVAPAMSDSVFVDRGAVELLGQVYAALVPVVDLEAQQAVIAALRATGDRRALPVLERALADPMRAVHDSARVAIRALGRPVPPSIPVGPPSPRPDWGELTALGLRPVLVLETEQGTLRVRMATDLAPVTVQTVARLAAAGAYDGTGFHRVVPDFVIQGGDVERGDGYGGPGFALRTEITGIPFRRGVVGLAAAGADTEGSQFFVTHSRQPHLDDAYVAFGWVEEGMDVVDRIAEGDRLVRVRVEADTTPPPDDAPTPGAP